MKRRSGLNSLLTAPGPEFQVSLAGQSLFGSGGFDITSDDSRVVYLSVHGGEERLHSAPTDGSAPAIHLGTINLADGDSSVFFWVAPGGARVVFRQGDYEIYGVPTDGSAAPVQLSPSGFSVQLLRFSPDGARAFYRVGVLWAVKVDGSESPIQITPTMPSFRRIDWFEITSDGSRAVYIADQDSDDVVELYSVPTDGSQAAVKLSSPLVPGGDVQAFFTISPDDSRVVYRADGSTDDVVELYSVPIDGSAAAAKLNDPLPPGRNVTHGVRISPDGSWVVYLADQDTAGVFELFGVPIDGSRAPARLHRPLVAGGDAGTSLRIEIGPTQRVVYLADQNVNDVTEVFSAPIDRGPFPRAYLRKLGPAVRLNSDLVPGGDIADFLISPDGSRVVFRGDSEVDGVFDLYSAAMDGSGVAIKLSDPVPPGLGIHRYLIGPNDRVVYAGLFSFYYIDVLYSVPIDRSSDPILLHP